MATWKKVITTADDADYKNSSNKVSRMISTSNSRSGYRQSLGVNYRWYWSIPSSYYGWKRNNRGNHVSGGVNSNAEPLNNNLPTSISGAVPFDYYFERDMKVTTNDKMKIHWHSSPTSAIFSNTMKLYFAPIIIPVSTVNTYRFSNNNYQAILDDDFEYLFSTGHDGTSASRGIVEADLSTISGYTSNDSAYSFGFKWTFPSDVTITRGSALLLFVTNTFNTSSGTSEYMRNLTAIIEGENV